MDKFCLLFRTLFPIFAILQRTESGQLVNGSAVVMHPLTSGVSGLIPRLGGIVFQSDLTMVGPSRFEHLISIRRTQHAQLKFSLRVSHYLTEMEQENDFLFTGCLVLNIFYRFLVKTQRCCLQAKISFLYSLPNQQAAVFCLVLYGYKVIQFSTSYPRLFIKEKHTAPHDKAQKCPANPT